MPEREDIIEFSREYIKVGGKQENFNRFFMKQFREANVSQANRLSEHLRTPEAQRMQMLMGGRSDSDLMP